MSTAFQVPLESAIPARAAFLRANSEAYEWLVERVQAMDPRKEAEAVLRQVVAAARFAAVFHPGRFADGAIENVALEIGTELGDFVTGGGGFRLPVVRKQSRRRVLHVVTDVLGIGGHTRMLYHWVRADRSSCHSVVLVDQRDVVPVPRWLSEAVQTSGGDLVVLPAVSDLCRKAKWLRETARRIADLVVLHHCPFDVVPTVAFAVRECPPVAVLNHADHLFWLGSSVADIGINLRRAGSEHAAERRFVARNTVIPIPLAEPRRQVSRNDARRALGIPEDQDVLLSVGRAEKYRPCGPYDFVATAARILDRQPSAHLYVVGESAAGMGPYLRCAPHERLHFVGSIEDPSLYRAAADVYLESFPLGSNTALLEAALSGLSVVPAYAPLFALLVASDDSVHEILPNPRHEEEYIDRVDLLIRQPDQRAKLGAMLRNRLLVDHTADGWLEKLTAMYQETDLLTHAPKPIPTSLCREMDADIGLSLWHVTADGETYSTGAAVDLGKAVLCHASFVAKDVGNYATARRYAWAAVRQDPLRRTSWRLLGVTLMGKTGRSLRQMLRRALTRI